MADLNKNWRNEAACAGMDTEIFFSVTAAGKDKAKRICGYCPVRLECLKTALAEERPGIDPDTGIMEGVFVNRQRRAGIRAGLTHTERWALQFPEEAKVYRDQESKRNERRSERRRTLRVGESRPRTESQKEARRERDRRSARKQESAA